MIKELKNILEAATIGLTSFKFDVSLLKNNNGDDTYPLTFIELPLLSLVDIESNGIQYISNVTLLIVTQRIDKTEEEQLNQLQDMYNLANQILDRLYINGISDISVLTYTGIINNEMSDDVNGVRVEFKIRTTVC
jgi:hypothetical protein